MNVAHLIILGVMVPVALAVAWPSERPSGIRPTEEQLAWQDLELGMFCHFGPNTFHDVEWGDGTADPDSFNPTEFDATQWVQAAKEAGFKYLIVTAKHHDGFCLWPTDQTDYSVRNSRWRDGEGDVVGAVAEACHEAGIKFGVYLSPWDRHEPCYSDNEAYDEFYMAQMTELLSNYGPVTEFWCDGAGGEGHVYNWNAYYRQLKSLQPHCLPAIAGVAEIRWVGNEDGFAPESMWNVVQRARKKYWFPAECDARIRANWFWHPDDADTLKSVDYLLKMYHGSVGRGANLLLNVGPDDRGLLPEQDVQRLHEFASARRSIYELNVMGECDVRASSQRDSHPAPAAFDKTADTYWQAAENNPQAWLQSDFEEPVMLDRFVTTEAIQLGQNIREYAIDVRQQNQWKRVCEGTSIGHKKIDILPQPLTADAVRLVVGEATATPALRTFKAYLAPEEHRGQQPPELQ